MFCWNCGTQVPDEAAFCAKCGKPQGQSSQIAEPRQAPQIWETCEIEIDQRNDLLNGAIYWFLAQAVGPKLQYTAGKTPELPVGSRFMSYPKSNDKKASVAHQALVAYLIANGWQALPDKGTNWWSHRFRRQIDPDWEECEIEPRILKRGITSAEFKFIAVVTKGPKGKYDGEESPLIVIKGKDRLDPDQSKTTPLVMDAFRNFEGQLPRAGWEPNTDCGKYWFNKRFRRPV